MKIRISMLAVILSALCLSGCATNSIKQVWKSPTYPPGKVSKVAVLAVDQRGLVRQGFENRFVNQFRAANQEAMVTHDLLTLQEIKADKEAVAERLRAAGADVILIVRLVDQATRSRQVQARPDLWVPTITGFGTCGWYDCYSVAFMDMGASWGSMVQQIYLDTSLFELKKGTRVWSAFTLTKLKEDADRLVEADDLVTKVEAAMRKDGLIH